MTLQAFDKSARRRHKRVEVGPFILKDPTLTPIDISESGIKIFSTRKLHVDRRISLKLNLHGELLELTGQVMWSRESSSIFEAGCYSGLVFVNYDISQQIQLRKFVERSLNKLDGNTVTTQSASAKNTPERRRHLRVKVAPYILKDPTLTPIDISESGMKLFSTKKLHVDGRIRLKLNLQGELLELTGQVMWSRESSSVFEVGYYSGLVFVNHDIAQQLILRAFVEQSLNRLEGNAELTS